MLTSNEPTESLRQRAQQHARRESAPVSAATGGVPGVPRTAP